MQQYLAARDKYQVVDEDPGDENNPNPQRKTYFLDAKKVIPLLNLTIEADIGPGAQGWQGARKETRTEFAYGSRTLAVFPGTTVFYPATVTQGWRKRGLDHYTLIFDDDDRKLQKIKIEHVVPLPLHFYPDGT